MSEDDDENLTDSRKTRWEYLGSVVALLMAVSLIVLILGGGLGIIALGSIPQTWFVLYASVCTAVFVYLYGAEAVEAFGRGGN